MAWSYSIHRHRATTIKALAEQTIQKLQILIEQGPIKEERYSPADFPQAELDQQTLDDLLGELEGNHSE